MLSKNCITLVENYPKQYFHLIILLFFLDFLPAGSYRVLTYFASPYRSPCHAERSEVSLHTLNLFNIVRSLPDRQAGFARSIALAYACTQEDSDSLNGY